MWEMITSANFYAALGYFESAQMCWHSAVSVKITCNKYLRVQIS